MAEVFLARHRGPGGFEKRLVIKRILPSLAADPRFLRLFFEEARLHVTLAHGNLVPIFDFGRVGNDYFLAMEYVEGADLGALLEAQRKAGQHLPPMCVAFIGQELCRALQHVHRNGLVHRDLTPRNVLISVDGEIKLSDFGVAQRGDVVGSVRGTVAYMAPEQARGEAVDARADLYSLGLVLAEAATGTRVRARNDEVNAGLAAASSATRVQIEGPFAAFVARATEPDPAARFPDALAMAAALEGIERQLGYSRAEASAALAERVRPISVPPGAEQQIAVSNEGPATYFRDAATQASIVEVIVQPPVVAPPRRSRAWIGALVIGIAAVAFVARGPWSGSTGGGRPSAQSPIEDLARAAPDLAGPPADLAAPPDLARSLPDLRRAGAVRPAITHHPRPHEPVAGEASLRVYCSPWCVIEIDGSRRGEDGREHVVKLPAGRHQLVARRLEDVQRRAIELSAGAEIRVDLGFE